MKINTVLIDAILCLFLALRCICVVHIGEPSVKTLCTLLSADFFRNDACLVSKALRAKQSAAILKRVSQHFVLVPERGNENITK